MPTQLVPLHTITVSGETLIRVKLDNSVITEYAKAMREGAEFPPVHLFPNTGGFYRIADGFHRVKAAGLAGRNEILAIVHEGDRNAALEFAIGANLKHGARITNADKRKIVIMALDAWPDRSDRAIADLCGVSNDFVSRLHKERLSSNDTPILAAQPQGVTMPVSSKYAPAEPQEPPPSAPPAPPRPAPSRKSTRKTSGAGGPSTAKKQRKPAVPKKPKVVVDPETQEKLNLLQTLISSLSIPHRKLLLKWLKIAVK